MAEVTVETVLNQLQAILKEAMQGGESLSYFTDPASDEGLLAYLEKISYTQALEPHGGSALAAHVYHLTFSMAASKAWIEGDRNPEEWEKSWLSPEFSAEDWQRLRKDLLTHYQDLMQAIEQHAASSEEAMGGALGAVTQVTYHLGAIRQKMIVGTA
ncbi:Hypothetical protein PBC10988_19890 [Planctomycetales bacterium 10988]|nr:Hypothetical protein PBC10988_19890 [Planctomycetales bacterium 10988]